MVIRLLQSDGRFSSASISEACDGEEVVQLVQSSLHSRREFDFILMDNVMVRHSTSFPICSLIDLFYF